MFDENSKFEIDNKIFNIKSLSLLQNFKKENLKLKPYPYLVIKNALPEEIYKHLIKNYPSDENISLEHEKYKHEIKINNLKKKLKEKIDIKKINKEIKYEKDILSNLNNKFKMNSNIRYDLPSIKKKEFEFLDPIWSLFIDYHNSKMFIDEVENIFKGHFTNLSNIKYKLSKNNKSNFHDLTFGVRKKNASTQNKDFVTDCQIGINSPCITDSFVRGPHIDNLNEVYAGLFYLKPDHDKTEGGNLEIYDLKENYNNLVEFQQKITCLKNENLKLDGRSYRRRNEFDKDKLKIIDIVNYDKNVFTLFINQINAIHGVSVRKKCNISRKLVNIIGESYFENGDEKKVKTPVWCKK
jgi:hypothetical protein